ncbi:MAG: lactonase family protein [Siphonobacter aquaeclarae]|nr:lactonase family protein [Siphonobacter aquaeclarae]
MKSIVLGLLAVCGLALTSVAQSNEYYLLVGTYTAATSQGIYLYKFNTATGDFAPVSIATGLKNPSFQAISPNKKFVYSVGEVAGGGAVYALSFDRKSGSLKLLNSQSAGGNGPCHVAVDKTGKWVIVGNYGAGSLTILPVQADGSLGAPLETIQHTGKGPNAKRQEKAHVHSINFAPNNKDIYVPDLGIDEVTHYQLNTQTGKLTEQAPAKVAPGAGPRHFTFHPNGKFAYVINELNGTVTGFRYGANGTLTEFQSISTLPESYKGESICADIHISPDGKFLYGSNRGHDSIAIYAIDAKTGKLTLVDITPSGGKHPRNFMIDPTGAFVLVANRDTDNVVIFRRDAQTGKITPTGRHIEVSMPVCLTTIPF